MRLQSNGQLQRFEIFHLRALKHFVQVQPDQPDESLRYVQLNPRSRLQLRRLIAIEVGALGPPRIAHHLPSVARQVRSMNDESSYGSPPRGLFELVRPPAVIRQRLTFEKVRVV